MLGGMGVPELLVIAAILLLIFGPSRLPKIARGLGETFKEFRNAGKQIVGEAEEVKRELDETVDEVTGRRRP